jgi:pilus assembly protein CpaF
MTFQEIYQRSTRYFLSPILPLLEDPAVTEVLINGPDQIYYESAGRLQLSGLRFADAALLQSAVMNIAEYVDRPLGDGHPTMDARLPDGSRVHVILPPCSRQGICVSIRKFLKATFDLDLLVRRGSLSAAAAEFLEVAVLLHKNIVVAGGTGTGKTSMLNALSAKIPEHERIVVIEDSSELQLHQPHTVYLEAQPPRPDGKGGVTIRDLFVNSLRMRPDRIVVGEVRRGEALDLVQSMISGHAGSLTTVHAVNPHATAARLEMLSMMSDVALPAHVARSQVSQALNLVVQLVRHDDGSRRIASISELMGLGGDGDYQIRDLFRFQAAGRDAQRRLLGELRATGERPTFASEPYEHGFEDHIRLTSGLFAPPV